MLTGNRVVAGGRWQLARGPIFRLTAGLMVRPASFPVKREMHVRDAKVPLSL